MNDLEWMARNVHEVPSYCKTISVVRLDSGEGRPFFHHDLCGTYSTQEWQAERTRLQSKPKWEVAPEWAEWLAQWPDGEWLFYPRRPNETNFGYCLEHSFGERLSSDMYGEILSDWRDTLERRPVSDMPPIHENMRCVMNSDIEKIEPDWTKAPDGTTHYYERGYMRWYKCENGGVCGYSDNRWVPLPLDVFSKKDKEELMEKPKEWRGLEDGLPTEHQLLLSKLKYDNKTGLFYRKDKLAGCVVKKKNKKYSKVYFFGKAHYAHRLAWFYVNGYWPDGEIDHINGNSLDNRIENLRDVSRRENCRNVKLSSSSKSGYCGVNWHDKAGKWRARVKIEGREHYIGLFDCPIEAAKRVQRLRVELGFHESHGDKHEIGVVTE